MPKYLLEIPIRGVFRFEVDAITPQAACAEFNPLEEISSIPSEMIDMNEDHWRVFEEKKGE